MVGLDLKITMHFHYGGKFEERNKKFHFVRETGCASIEYDCDRLSLPELDSILKEDCKYKGNVTELWWRNCRKGNELRRIIGDKEVVDMVTKLGKCKVVHIYAIDELIEGLALPLVISNFVDEKCAITHTKEAIEPILPKNIDCIDKVNVKPMFKANVGVVSTRKERIQRSFSLRQNEGQSTRVDYGKINFT